MKNLSKFTLIAFAAISFTFTSCGGESQTTETDTATEESATEGTDGTSADSATTTVEGDTAAAAGH